MRLLVAFLNVLEGSEKIYNVLEDLEQSNT